MTDKEYREVSIMDKDEQYKYYAEVIFSEASTREYYFEHTAADSGYSERTKHCVWLCLMGLMETWDMI